MGAWTEQKLTTPWGSASHWLRDSADPAKTQHIMSKLVTPHEPVGTHAGHVYLEIHFFPNEIS